MTTLQALLLGFWIGMAVMLSIILIDRFVTSRKKK